MEKKGDSFVVSIIKNGRDGEEKSAFTISATENAAAALFKKLKRCGVTPMSLVYIIEDDGFAIVS